MQVVRRTHGIPSIALRYGMFVPEPFFLYGPALRAGVDRDVARSVMASMETLMGGGVTWDTFNVESVVPFQEEDAEQLARDPMPVLDKYYPGAVELLRERVLRAWRRSRCTTRWTMVDVLGFRPECNFDQWLEELRGRPEERAEKSPPWP